MNEVYPVRRKEGLREVHALQSKGENPYMIALADSVPNWDRLAQVRVGLTQIDLDQIVGTVTKGRSNAFSRSFYPLLEEHSEFGLKWGSLYDSVEEKGMTDPIKVYEYYNRYYVLEGNKRVSVMTALDAVSIEADVIRLLPEAEDSPRYRTYQAFLRFWNDTRITTLVFSSAARYDRLYTLAGKEPGQRWTEDESGLLDHTFKQFFIAYTQAAHGRPPMSPSDAFLILLSVQGWQESMMMTLSSFQELVRKMWQEFVVAGVNKPVKMVDRPAEKKPGVLQTLFQPSKKIRCAFVYNSAPGISGWTYWHELARKALDNEMGSNIETICRCNVKTDEAEAVIGDLVKDGWDVIFATSPVFLDACVKLSLAYPKARILNCSMMGGYYHVRSYYLRIYEAKFVLGALAGAMAQNDLVGYIADYPIPGTPASVNAFALGARMTNPRARVLLDWSTIPGHDPEKALAERGVQVFSNRDIGAPVLGTRSFGLYRLENGAVTNLAMPVWNWYRLYSDILRSITTNAFAEEEGARTDEATGYYMGMNAGAIDIIYSEKLPGGVQHLCELLQEQVASMALRPFADSVVDQSGTERIPARVNPTPNEILRMDYLLQNVEGRLPDAEELSPAAQQLLALSGFDASGPRGEPAGAESPQT